MEREFAKLDDVQQEIDDNRGFTGTNLAAALFWWPALAYTYYDAGEAEDLVEQRRFYLTDLYHKNCAGTLDEPRGSSLERTASEEGRGQHVRPIQRSVGRTALEQGGGQGPELMQR